MPKETPGETEFPQSRSLQKPSSSVVLGKPMAQVFLMQITYKIREMFMYKQKHSIILNL